MTHIEDVLLWAIAQKGDRYVFGAEVAATAADATDATEWDCSELVEWSSRKAGVQPRVPDGAFNQWAACRQAGTMIGVVDGINTRGALLFPRRRHGQRSGCRPCAPSRRSTASPSTASSVPRRGRPSGERR